MRYTKLIAIQCQIEVSVESDTDDTANHIAKIEIKHLLESIGAKRIKTNIVREDELTF